jgi:hypothetical protein
VKLYHLQPDLHYGIYTGHIKDGSQIILSHYDDVLLAVLFNAGGNIFELRQKALSKDVRERHLQYRQVLQAWISELELDIHPILIKAFFLENYVIGIKELTWDFDYFLSHESDYSDEEKTSYQQMIKDWKDSGEFIFHWANDFWCDREGYIIAS